MAPDAVVLQEGDSKNRAAITFKETAQIRHVIIGILPSVKITNLNRDANLAKSEDSCTLRLTVSPAKSQRKVVEKGSVELLKNQKQMGCVIQDFRPPQSKSILRKSTKSSGPKRSVLSQKGTLHHVKKSGKKGSIAKVVFRSANHTSVVLMLQCLRIEHRKKPCNKNDVPAEMRGKWLKVSTSSKKRTKLYSSRLRMFGVYQRHP